MTKTPILDAVDAERSEVDAVLAALERAPKLMKLLRYLAEKHFAGDGDQLTEFRIATEVFEKKETSFIASEDAVARVETHRLRKKLRAYYSTEGRDHPIQITIPLGMYAPVFVRKAADLAPVRDLSDEPKTEAEPRFIPDSAVPGPEIEQESSALSPAEKHAGSANLVAPPTSGKRILICLGTVLTLMVLAVGTYVFIRSHRHFAAPKDSAVDSAPTRARGSSASGLNALPITLPFRMIAGYSGPPQTDISGEIWQADQYYKNGSPMHRSITFIDGTTDPLIFRYGRTGNFDYDIPLGPRTYELHLYFASITATLKPEDDSNACLFSIYINGKVVLPDFDPVSDAMGLNIADERVIRDVSADTDGVLHLHVTSGVGVPFLSAMEIVRGTAGRQLPVRISTQATPWTDPAGQLWHPDSYFRGGRRLSHNLAGNLGANADLYSTERYGHFSYSIPVDPRDTYTVILHFAELYWGREDSSQNDVGKRIFRVMCNGTTLLDNFDIFREAGAGKPLIKTFMHLKPSAQGKLNLTFEPVKNYATVSAIEVLDESK